MHVEQVFNTFLEHLFNGTQEATFVLAGAALLLVQPRVPARFVRKGALDGREGYLFRPRDTSLNGGFVHPEERRQPHAVLDNDDVRSRPG